MLAFTWKSARTYLDYSELLPGPANAASLDSRDAGLDAEGFDHGASRLIQTHARHL
jgi:hypothetical protein